MSYLTRDVLLNKTAQAVSASATEQAVSKPFGLSAPDSLDFLAYLKLSAGVAGTGVTFKLQHTPGDGVWYNVGSSAQAAAVQKTLTAGTREVTDLTAPNFATVGQGDHFYIVAQDGNTYSIWLDKDANGTAPTGALHAAATTKIEVDIVTGDTDAQVAGKIRTAVLANAAFVADFGVSALSTATFTITQVLGGAVADPVPYASDELAAGALTVSVTTAGSNGTAINLTTNVFTSVAHGFVTGDRVVVSSSGGLPTGLTTGEYWVIKVDADTFKLATTLALSQAGTAVDVTGDYGYGTVRLVQADYTIRMLTQDSTDVAQLPLWPTARLVVDSGSGDSCTVSAIRVSERS